MIRYARTPSASFVLMLSPGGFLSPLLENRIVGNLPVDIHFREDDHIHIYCGLTRLVDACLLTDRRVRISADEAYTTQSCAGGLFRVWASTEIGFSAAVASYFASVKIRQALLRSEGRVQSDWASVKSPWISFDREAVLGYDDTATQKAGRVFPSVDKARCEIERLQKTSKWALLPENKTNAELDKLGVDPEGRLVLIELKDAAASSASVYYSPFQLLQYVHEWAAAFDIVKAQLASLIEARTKLGLSPTSTPQLTEGGKLRPVVAFGKDRCSKEVHSRFDKVLSIVNRQLPASASPIAVWAMGKSGPVQL